LIIFFPVTTLDIRSDFVSDIPIDFSFSVVSVLFFI